MHPDDERLARASRVLRRQSGLRQQDVVRLGRTRHFVQVLEAGEAGRLRIQDVRDYFGDLGGHARLTVSWNGAQLDRLLDGRHARIVELAIRAVRGYGWPTLSEVTFAEFGERGSVDVFAADEGRSGVFVGEAKSEWGSIEETNRLLDVKARLAPKLVFDRFGWRPRFVAKVLILPEDGSSRRIARRFEATLSYTYPARAREMRTWLRKPDRPLAGLWFLSDAL